MKKSEVFNKLQKQWTSDRSPEDLIQELRKFQAAYMDISAAANINGFDSHLADAIARSSAYGMPSSALPFLMQVYRAVEIGAIDEDVAGEIFATIEAFLVRRAICGVEPTGLHAVFKSLWNSVSSSPSSGKIEAEIQKSSTVFWPDDSSVVEAVAKRPLYGSKITPFILVELNRSMGGDVPSDAITVEHILPQKPKAVTTPNSTKLSGPSSYTRSQTYFH